MAKKAATKKAAAKESPKATKKAAGKSLPPWMGDKEMPAKKGAKGKGKDCCK
jgi:hypothetical protein